MTGTAYQQPEDRSMTEQGAIITLARYRAKQRIKEDWLAPGRTLSEITAADVVWWAEHGWAHILRCWTTGSSPLSSRYPLRAPMICLFSGA
jgi:hypothetical protein